MKNEEPKQIKCYCGHTTTCDCSPKEEPNDVVLGYKTSLDAQMLDKIEPKQETLEAAAERFYHIAKGGSMWMPSADDCNKANKQEGFIQGAKWQQERRYSEEDKIMKFLDTEIKLGLSDIKTIKRIKWYFETYFEQFKKK